MSCFVVQLSSLEKFSHFIFSSPYWECDQKESSSLRRSSPVQQTNMTSYELFYVTKYKRMSVNWFLVSVVNFTQNSGMTVYPRTMGKQINMQFTNTIRYLGLVLFTKRKWEIWQGRPVCVCVCVLELSRYIFTQRSTTRARDRLTTTPPATPSTSSLWSR